MKRELSPGYVGLLLILGCIIFRLVTSHYPELMPNVSPLLAVALVGAMYLPHRWSWLVGPAVLIVTEIAFLSLNARADGVANTFSWWSLFSLGLYASIGGLGILISQRPTLAKVIGGTVGGSLLFYVVSNTFSWWHMIPTYPATFAGWVQANTVGLAGYEPTWHFLRNGMAGDLFFVAVLLLFLDRQFLLGQMPARTATRAA